MYLGLVQISYDNISMLRDVVWCQILTTDPIDSQTDYYVQAALTSAVNALIHCGTILVFQAGYVLYRPFFLYK